MKKWVLPNGLKVIYEQKKTDSVAVQMLVNIGSDWEPAPLRGISHFLEHMVFEGTEKRANAKEIANEIERVGGDSNAYTTNSRTCYHAKVPRKHAAVALDVTADILQNPLFRKEDTERQKNILFKEIDLTTDEPRFHQWILFQKTMFHKHPSKFPTYGSRATVQAMTHQDLKKFFDRYYTPKNMVLSVVGDVPDIKERVEGLFVKKNSGVRLAALPKEPLQRSNRITREKRKDVANSYLVLGHRTLSRLHTDSYVLDVVNAILGRGQSGWMFDEIRNKCGLAYEVGTQHSVEKDNGYFATYSSVDKKNIARVREMILGQLKKMEWVSEADVKEAKTYVEGNFLLEHEDTQKLADEILYWEQMGDARLMESYLLRINAVTVRDVQRVAKTYFRKPFCMAVIEGK